MKNFSEVEIKYLAGLLDADGSMSFRFTKNPVGKVYTGLELRLVASEKIDKGGVYIDYLRSIMGYKYHRVFKDGAASPQNWWRVTKRAELNKILPRLLKHMVIKGKHWNNLYQIYISLQGKHVSDIEINRLKKLSKDSRREAGPIKAKNFATKAWTSGVIDGDGYLQIRNNRRLSVVINLHPDDRVALELLQKTYGGYIRDINNHNIVRWERNLGPKDKNFAIPFLKSIHRYSKLKKWKIEQMLKILNNHSQRLTEKPPKGEVIV